jgi:glyceraldehyde 3-phosphate dehydrogenase
MINIGINGFGRIGRMVCRAVFEKYTNICDIVAINDPYLKIDDIIYLLQYDSIHGKLNKTIEKKDNFIIIDNKKIAIFHILEPQNIPWNLSNTLYVCESSGVFLDMESCKNHLLNGVKKVIISTPTIDTPLYIMGVNHHLYDKNDHIISNGSCTTNCLGPLIKLLNDTYGIVECFATTIHASTSSQKIVDMGGINKRRSYRSALCNIIPTPTKAIKAVLQIIPELEGKLTGLAFRIPIANVSVLDLSLN